MNWRSRTSVAITLAAFSATMVACGGGTPVTTVPVPASIEVRVSAGMPVAGATVTVYAISDVTGLVDASAGAGGVLGSAGPTDASGTVTVSLRSYSGPVQIVAKGPALFFPDPTTAPDDSGVVPSVQVPSSFTFSSYVASFAKGGVVPVTLLTTLADHAALAYARGRHSSHPSKTTITQALAARDPLFVTHVTNAAAAWSPGSLRTTEPAILTRGPQSLVDVTFAALFDLAMNQLARDTAVKAGYGTGPGGLTAPTLIQLLEDDLDADGRLDGIGAGGQPIYTAGNTPVALDAQFLRKPLAVALLGWVRNTGANKSGISDADLASAQVFRSMSEDGSDLFGGAPAQPFDPLDRTPPVLAFAGSPPAFKFSPDVTLSVSASDSSGVKAVHALCGAIQTSGVLSNGVWLLNVHLSSVGHNTVVIWAEDLAEPAPNSGAGMGQPHQLAVDIVWDPDPPGATYDATFASYADESSLAVATGVEGLATVPAVYSQPPRAAIPNGGNIYKAATRLEAGAAFDAAELESTNLSNTPVLRFLVPFNANTDAPITTADFEVSLACEGCGAVPAARGALLPSPTAAPQALYFDLPLSVETVPALAQVTGPAALNVALNLGDAAGNASTVGGFSFTFHVVGPPVAVVEDTAFATYGDPRSTYPYRVHGQTAGVDTYSTLFDPASRNFFGGQVRLLRYVLSNPSPKPVAVRATYAQAASGSWKVSEVWPRISYADLPSPFPRTGPSGSFTRPIDAFTFYQALYWATPYGSQGARLAKTETAPHPCGGPGNGTPAHKMGDYVNRWTCLPDSVWTTPTTAVFASSAISPVVFAGPQQGGGEVVAPATDATGTVFVVPGAVGATPGTLVLYLTRPTAAARTRPLVVNAIGNMGWYETYDYEAALKYETWTYSSFQGTFVYDTYVLFKTGEYLESANESIEGTLSVATQGLAGAQLFGEPSVPFSTTLTRTVSTH